MKGKKGNAFIVIIILIVVVGFIAVKYPDILDKLNLDGNSTSKLNKTCEHLNQCGSKCLIDNQGLDNVSCIAVCEEICECGGVSNWQCPDDYYCKIPANWMSGENKCILEGAKGYCVER